LLEAIGVSKRFDDPFVLRDVDLAVERGELTAIIGPNGAGKSTLINVLSGRYDPTDGELRWSGRPYTGANADHISRMRIGRNFQQPSIFPTLSVRENVAVPLLRVQHRHVMPFGTWGAGVLNSLDGPLRAVGLIDQSFVRAADLAYGDQRRLEIAIALAGGPELLLLDEPMAGMSTAERQQLSKLISDLNAERGLTIVFTEHDMDIVFTLARKVHVLHQGRLIATGTPEEIRRNAEVRIVYLGDTDDG
jgi:branched-chain amino acid transport system ATP-binding protein